MPSEDLLSLRVKQHADERPDQLVLSFLDPDLQVVDALTYRRLDRDARAIAAQLLDRGLAGAPVVLSFPAGLDFVAAFCGCLYAGSIAVPATLPLSRRSQQRLAAILHDSGAACVLTTAGRVGDVEPHVANGSTPVDVVAVDPRTPTAPPDSLPDPDPGQLAFLQYTSGSTRSPRGVMVRHRDLTANLYALREVFGTSLDSVGVSWLPVFHDMGLIAGVLLPVWQGYPTQLLAPTTFIRDPLCWLRAISKSRGTHGGAPNFAYDACADAAQVADLGDLDLASWRVAWNGAEPVRAETMRRFRKRFAPQGFRPESFAPGYGLAEATLVVSGNDGSRLAVELTVDESALHAGEVIVCGPADAGARPLVGSGRTPAGIDERIVAPQIAREVAPHTVGEIWIRSDSTAQGYWRKPTETAETFDAYLHTGEGPFLRTGDLGFTHDRELFVVGRIKDTIVIRGVNYYPHDIEYSVAESHRALAPAGGAVIGVEAAGQVDLVAAAEIRRELRDGLTDRDAAAVVDAIRRTVARDHQLALRRVVLLAPGGLPKTSSGKVQRGRTRDELTAETLPVVHDWQMPGDRSAPLDLGAESLTQPGVLERHFLAWLQRELSDHGLDLAYTFDRAGHRVSPRCGAGSRALGGIRPRLAGDIDARPSNGRLAGRPHPPHQARPLYRIHAIGQHYGTYIQPGADPGAGRRRARRRPAAAHRRGLERNHSMTEHNGVAIVGYAARLPGAVDATEYWNVLTDGRDTTSEVPGDRWDVDEFYDVDADAPGKMISRRAGFVDDVAGFDAPFFGVSAREAMYMDPQHRLMLETTWSAIEHAGIAPSALAGSPTGVFMGLSTHEFLGMLIRYSSYESVDIYSGTGTSPAAGAGRISFRLGLVGPAVVVDTACSSSLVAVHQACLALEAGDCDMALVGGVNVILTPVPMINLTRARMLAPDGHCKTFDAAADGYVRGEGCGVVVLKRVAAAQRDGDHIRAVIRSSAVNQDGASGGLTVPNGIAQQQVISDALRRSGLSGHDIDYLEAHGTGTSLGDPIEVQAAGAVFGAGRDADRPLLIGSVKTNIGHLEAASGIAGVIKVVLSLENELLPKHLHFNNPSPHIPWDRLPVRVVDEPMPWPRNGRPRVAGVSSFGFSGTNAHVLVEEAPHIAPASPAAQDPNSRRYHVLPVSARSPEALKQMASRYRDWLDANPEASIVEVCATAGTGRSHFEHRAALVVNSRTRARRLLAAVHEENPAPGLVRGVGADRPKTAWLFPGQGTQYPGMAKGLFDSEPVFADTLRRCADAVDGVLPQRLLDVIFGDDAKTLSHTAFAQTALFAVEMGLAELWRAWGITPDVVLGHSVGQYAAACVAGVLSLDDGIRLIAERGRLFGALPDGGRMVAVFADSDRVEEGAADFPRVSVAGYNGASTVLSGSAEDLDRVTATLSAAGVRCEWLDTSHAFHSALLDPALDEFESYAGRFTYHEPQIALVCNRTGKVLTRQARIDAQYWRGHARQPVRFADSVHTLARLGCTALMDVGPQPILTAAALRIWPDSATSPHTIASLRRDVDAQRCFSEALAAAYAAGYPLDFAARYHGVHRLDLPTYPFQRRAYWFPTTAAPLTSVEKPQQKRWPMKLPGMCIGWPTHLPKTCRFGSRT